MVPVFTSVACQNNCEQRELTVARALYDAALDSGVWFDPWDDLDDEVREFFLKYARVAIKALESI